MPHGGPHQGTQVQQPDLTIPDERTDEQKCRDNGGVWDPTTQTCILIKDEPIPEPKPTSPQIAGAKETPFERAERAAFSRVGPPTAAAAIEQKQLQQQQGQQLAGQVGQFQQLGVEPTGLQFGEAGIVGLTDAIPSAIATAGAIAGGGAVLGGAIGTAGGPLGTAGGAALGAAIGACAGFVAGLTRAMVGSFKGQRRDTTTAQQRILDEGKQAMKDWATMAESDPANRARYLAEFNKVSAQIDQAYRQMKLDTSRDLAKFETALPNLAEFEAFYAVAGERDFLNTEMQQALLTFSPPNYNMLELTNRRKPEE